MTIPSQSPYLKAEPGLRIVKGAQTVPRPKKEDVPLFKKEAEKLLDKIWSAQSSSLKNNEYSLDWLKGKHFILAGATGPGLGGSLAAAVLNTLDEKGSLTVISRDPSRSVGYETGLKMQEIALNNGLAERFTWSNNGLAIEGESFENIISILKSKKVDSVIYINTVAAANSGVLPGFPPIYVKDIDEEGLFQWELLELSERNIETTKFIMGEMAVRFSDELENAGIKVEATAFADWRGSLDRSSRNPKNPEYGRWGSYSTSLYLPKDYIHEAVSNAYGTNKRMIDFFLPVMRSRALEFIPGGSTLSNVFNKLMDKEGVRRIDIPELALGMLHQLGRSTEGGDDNPFPRLDAHELPFDLWFFEVTKKLTTDENSDYYFKRWMVE